VPLLVKGLEERGLAITHAARVLAANPAALFRIDDLKGALAVGRDADVTLLRRDAYVYRGGDSGANVVAWSPYEGMTLPWRVHAAYLRGTAIAEDGKVVAAPGSGRFVSPGAKVLAAAA